MYWFVIISVMVLSTVQFLTVYTLVEKYAVQNESWWKQFLSIPFIMLNMGIVLLAGRYAIISILGDVYS